MVWQTRFIFTLLIKHVQKIYVYRMINSPAQILEKRKNILAVYYKAHRKNLRATPGGC